MRLNDLFENNNKNRGYEPGFASPNAPTDLGRPTDHRGLGQELAHERNNYGVHFDGKKDPWKVFADQREAENIAKSLRAKGRKVDVFVTGAPATNEEQGLNEFAPGQGGGDSGNYFQALASAWYNGTFDSGSLQKGIKSQEDVERLLQRGIVCPDGVTRKFDIGYNSNFDGVVISSDDYYEHADHDETDSRTGKPFGPYDYMEFGDDDLDESAKYRDPKYKDKLYTQEKPDYNDTREYDRARWNPKPKGYPGRKELSGGGEFPRTDPLKRGQGIGRSGIKNNINLSGKRKGLPSRDQITSLKGSIKDAHGRHTRANLPEGMEGQVVFSGTGADGGKYEIIQSGPTDFMIHANGRHIDTYSSLQRAMSVLKNEVVGLKKNSLNEFAPSDDSGDNGPDEEEILHKLASIWWLGNEQQMARAERALASMGWEIGEDEGYDDGGVFVVRAGDVNGKSYISWPHADLQLNEAAPVDQLARDYGARTYAAPGSGSVTAEPLPPKFEPGKEPVPTLPGPGDQIGTAFQKAQDREQEYQAWAAGKRKEVPGYAAREKQNYQDDIVNPEFMNDLTDPGPEPVTPAKPVTSTAPVDNNAGATTGSALRDKINQAAGNQSDNSPLKAPNPVLSSPTQTIVKPPAKPAANNTGTNSLTTSPNIWQGAADPKDFGGALVNPPSKSGVVSKADLEDYRLKSGNPTATLGQYMNQQKGLTARKGGANDPAVIAAKAKQQPYKQTYRTPVVRESSAQNDLYQILRNAGLKNTP